MAKQNKEPFFPFNFPLQMALQCRDILSLHLFLQWLSFGSSFGWQYLVGDSVWSIPPYPHFYDDWSSSHLFRAGDSLVFDFEPELYNLMQVTTLDYQNCRANNPIKVLYAGPATIVYNEPGVFYYLCNLSNYCDLGQKISVVVHHKNFPPAPAPAPAAPCTQPLTPFLTPFLQPNPSPADWNASDSPRPVAVSSEAPPPSPSPVADLGEASTSGARLNRHQTLSHRPAFYFLMLSSIFW